MGGLGGWWRCAAPESHFFWFKRVQGVLRGYVGLSVFCRIWAGYASLRAISQGAGRYRLRAGLQAIKKPAVKTAGLIPLKPSIVKYGEYPRRPQIYDPQPVSANQMPWPPAAQRRAGGGLIRIFPIQPPVFSGNFFSGISLAPSTASLMRPAQARSGPACRYSATQPPAAG